MTVSAQGTAGWVLALGAVIGLQACSPVIRNHGYTPAAGEVEQIRIGQDTRGSVRRKIGRPGSTGVFTDDGWFYISSTVEHLTYNAPEVTERRIVAVLFDERDVVSAVDRYSLEDGRLIDLETKTTPTRGRELTILEQAIGNIGINAEQVLGTNQ